MIILSRVILHFYVRDFVKTTVQFLQSIKILSCLFNIPQSHYNICKLHNLLLVAIESTGVYNGIKTSPNCDNSTNHIEWFSNTVLSPFEVLFLGFSEGSANWHKIEVAITKATRTPGSKNTPRYPMISDTINQGWQVSSAWWKQPDKIPV